MHSLRRVDPYQVVLRVAVDALVVRVDTDESGRLIDHHRDDLLAAPGRAGYSAASVLSFARQRIQSGKQVITVVVDQAPKFVGVDPYNKRIDRNSGDNLVRVDAP